MRACSKRVKALSIDGLCHWPEREQPTPTHLQRRRVYKEIEDAHQRQASEASEHIPKTLEVARQRQATEAPEHIPKHLTLRDSAK